MTFLRCLGLPLVSALLLSSACTPAPADRATLSSDALAPRVRATGIAAPAPAEFVAFADTMHGVVVPDPLRWLEDTLAANTRAWVTNQSAYTDSVLARLVGRDSIAAGIERAYAAMPTIGTVVHTPTRTFLTRYLSESPSMMVVDSGQRAEREILSAKNMARLRPGARIRTFVPSWDGRYVALGITARGDANPAIVVVDAVNGGLVRDGVPDLFTTQSDTQYEVTWLPDGSGFFYPRLFATSSVDPTEQLNRGRQFLHRMGTPQSADVPVFGFGVSPTVPMEKIDVPSRVGTSANSSWMFGTIYRARQNATDYYASPLPTGNEAPTWIQIASGADRITALKLHGDTVYGLARKDADRGKVVRQVLRSGATARSAWETVIPERAAVITGYVVQDDGIYFTERGAGAIALLRLAPGATTAVRIPMPVEGNVRLARVQSGAGATVSLDSWATVQHWLFASGDTARALGIDDGYAASAAADVITERLQARSKDGTMVPVSVVYGKAALRNGRLDGTAPLLIESYGGFGQSTDPGMDPLIRYLVEQGVVYAWAHVRGGGELGDAWHMAATRERKQNTFDDMIGAIEHLIAKRYTSAKRVTLSGMSFGATIPGMVMAQRPDLLGAVLYEVGEPDEVRGASTDPTAARNIAEIGDVDTPEGIRMLMRTSPYHQVPDTIALPAVIVHSASDDYNFSTGMLAAKYVARLQRANSSARPVLWVPTAGGHTTLFGVSPQWAATTISFMLWQTGHPRYQPVR